MATYCIPDAPGVPGLGGQPPYWLPGGAYPQRTEQDDPRWRGAFQRTDPNGEIVFRALYDVEGGQKHLYLSWLVPFVENLDDTHDRLWVGILPGGGTTAMVIEVQVHPNENPAQAELVGAVDVYTKTQVGGAWQAGAWSAAGEPTWISQNTRRWVVPGGGTSGSYAVHMRVPISAAGGVTNDAGPQLGDAFDVWFYLRGGSNVGPVELAELPDLGTTPLNLNDAEFPVPTAGGGWDHVSTIVGDASCPTVGGVALASNDVGTTSTPSSRILFNGAVPLGSRPVNTFFARPRNYTGAMIPAGAIDARFRIANWGSIADPNAAWIPIPPDPGGSNPSPSTSNIGTIPAGSSPPASNPITLNWTLTDGHIATFITGSTPHKCILVELTGPGLTFFNDSVYRNMDFVSASVFQRAAEISIVGLAPVPGGGPRRDVYLAIEKRNMPPLVTPGKGPTGKDPIELPPEPAFEDPDGPGRGEKPRTVSRAEAIALAKRGQLTEEVIQTFMPTYRVHVYHDTGHRIGGRPVLRPQTSYGVFVEHEGDLVGWRDQLQAPPGAQLQEIADDFFKIVVPNDGVMQVTTVIDAVEPGEVPRNLWEKFWTWFRGLPRWLQILLLILLLLVLLILLV